MYAKLLKLACVFFNHEVAAFCFVQGSEIVHPERRPLPLHIINIVVNSWFYWYEATYIKDVIIHVDIVIHIIVYVKNGRTDT